MHIMIVVDTTGALTVLIKYIDEIPARRDNKAHKETGDVKYEKQCK
uniref:Uncharacterized protein n=1 Tax=Ciona savignyi TaxID=51511 RepID=H2ZM10_CIOSA